MLNLILAVFNLMMLGIGIDIVDVNRMENALSDAQEVFLKRVFTQREILNSHKFDNRAEYLSFLFAFKESFVKAQGTGFTSLAKPKHIEIRFRPKEKKFKKPALQDINAYFKNQKINLINFQYFKLKHNLVCGLIVGF